MWPDIERAYVTILREAVGVRTATDIPGDVETIPTGFIRVARGPGSDDGITDQPLLDVEAFHPDRHGAERLAEQARQAILNSPNQIGVLVDAATTASTPTRVFYSPNVERYVASYRLRLRRPRA